MLCKKSLHCFLGNNNKKYSAHVQSRHKDYWPNHIFIVLLVKSADEESMGRDPMDTEDGYMI